MVFMSAGASLALTAPALKGCLWFYSLVTGGTCLPYIKTLFSLPRIMLFYKTQADMGTLLLRFPSLRQALEISWSLSFSVLIIQAICA